MSDETRHIVAWILIALAVGDIVITLVAIWVARRVNEPAMTDRAATSLLETIVASSLAFLSAAFVAGIVLAPVLVSILFIGALLLVSLPNYVWIVSWLVGRFR